MNLPHSEVGVVIGMAVYRQSKSQFAVGIAFIVVPIVGFTIPTFLYWLSETPMMLRNQSNNWHDLHQASPSELLAMGLCPLLVSACGCLLVRDWKNNGIFTNADGVRRVRGQRGVSFEARWQELTKVETHARDKGQVAIVLRTEGKKVEFLTTKSNSVALVDEIKHHNSGIEFSDFES